MDKISLERTNEIISSINKSDGWSNCCTDKEYNFFYKMLMKFPRNFSLNDIIHKYKNYLEIEDTFKGLM